MSKKNSPSKAVESLYGEIKQIIEEARDRVYRTANFAMVQAYWNVGRLIVKQEQHGKDRAEYGNELIKELSARLSMEYGKGFDKTNVWNIRKFYSTFPKIDALRQELSSQYKTYLPSEKQLKEEIEREREQVEIEKGLQ